MMGLEVAVAPAGPMQITCTLLQTDNHTNTSALSFYRSDALRDAQPTVSKYWSIYYYYLAHYGWLSSWVVSVLDSGAEGPGFKSQPWQTVHTHCASVHQAAKLVVALLRVAGVTAGLAESNGSLPPGLWLTSPAGWLPSTRISSGTLCLVIEYGLPLPFLLGPLHCSCIATVSCLFADQLGGCGQLNARPLCLSDEDCWWHSDTEGD